MATWQVSTNVQLPEPVAVATKLIRPSERGDFLECPWKWHKSWIEGLTGQRVPTWAWFGGAIHKGLEVRYPVGRKRGHPVDVIDAFKEAVDNEERRVYTMGGELDEEEVVDGIELGVAMLKGYMKFYGQDRHWQIVHSEQTFQIDVPNPRSRSEQIIAILCGTWDMVVWDLVDKCYRVVDHKTRRSFPKLWTFYDLNFQGGSYLWVAPEVLRHKGIFGPKDRLDGIIFNCLKKAMPDERPRDREGQCLNKDGSVSLKQPGPLFYRHTSHRSPQERVRQARHVIAEAYHMHRILSGKAPLLKHPTEQCPSCTFFEVCELDESDPAAAAHMARNLYVRRDPYAAHREAMEQNGLSITASAREKNGTNTRTKTTTTSAGTPRRPAPRSAATKGDRQPPGR